MIELAIKISNDEQHYTQKFLIYKEDIVLNRNDPELLRMLKETMENFKGPVEDVLVKIKFTW
jgi:hypothetical protein